MKKIFYRVEKFDTLIKISNAFNIPASVIIYDNNLKKDVEQGDLIILNIKTDKRIKTVMPSDSIFSICKELGVLTESILKDNRVDYIYPFQKIWV